MSVSRRYTIRIALHDDQLDNRDLMSFIESLRYNGILSVLKINTNDPVRIIEIPAPKDIPNSRTREWAESRAMRMKSFGFNSVCAPAWDHRTDPEYV